MSIFLPTTPVTLDTDADRILLQNFAKGKASIATRSYSGRVGGSEGKEVRLRQYARHVDAALRGLPAGSHVPLVLASVQPLGAIYRSVNTCPHPAAKGIEGNAGRLSDAELASAAREVLDGPYRAGIANWHALYRSRLNEDRAATDLARTARAGPGPRPDRTASTAAPAAVRWVQPSGPTRRRSPVGATVGTSGDGARRRA